MTDKIRPIPFSDDDISKGDVIGWLYPNTGRVEWNDECWKVRGLTKEFKEKYEETLRRNYFEIV